MTTSEDSRRPLVNATVVATVLQLVMVIIGHSHPAVAQQFAAGGMSISALGGIVYAVWAKPPTLGTALWGGAVAGGLSALIGIAASYLLHDVPAVVLAFGTASSAVTGAIGGAIGRALGGRSAA
jgi:hypothetical protein